MKWNYRRKEMVKKCLKCKSTLKMVKQDKYRFWYECVNDDCKFVCTEPKPLNNKMLKELEQK